LFGSGCSFNGLTRQGDDELGGNADPVVANPNFNLAAQAFGRGPEHRLRATFGRVDPPFCRGAFFANTRFYFRVVDQDPQSQETAKGYARRRAANVNGLTFR